MAGRSRELKIIIAGDADKFDRENRRAVEGLEKLGKQARLTASISSKGYSVMRIGAAGAAGALGGLVLGGKEVVQAASDISESLSKNQVLFGKYAKGVDDFTKTSATAFGISREAALEYTGVFGNLFTALGVSRNKSAEFSVSLTKLAADMASFNNTSIDDALEAIRSGLVGETEPLRRFGVNLNDATLRQEAMALGLTNTTKHVLTPYQRSMAAQALIVKQTDKAHGDFHRTQGGLANQTRILEAQFSDIKGELGEQLLPVVTKGARSVNRFVKEVEDGTGAGGEFADTAKQIADDVKPVVTWIGRATGSVAKFTAEHPDVGKLAAAILGVGAAVKTLKFVSATTGLNDLVKAGSVAGKGLKRVLARGATEAGETAAANTAEGMASQMPASLKARQGRLNESMGKSGRLAGKTFGIAAGIAAAVAFAESDVAKDLGRKINNALPGGNESKARSQWVQDMFDSGMSPQQYLKNHPIPKAAGGIIPGVGNRDTVPVMGTPGEFVIRKKIVEKYGPTFFAAINAGREPQLRATGGVIGPSTVGKMQSAARGWVGLPYKYGAGHSGFGPSGGGFDCSGFVSAVLGVGGAIGSPMAVRQPLQSALLPGPGKYVTVGIRGSSGRNAHTMIKVGGRYFEAASHGVVESGGWRGSFDLFHPRNEATSGGVTEKDPGQADGAGGGSSAPSRSEKRARAGSRVVNAIVAKDLKGVGSIVRGANSLGAAIDDADTTYGQTERLFGQVVGGKAGAYGDENLGTKEGRAARTSELAALEQLKVAQQRRQLKRKAALEKAVKRYDKLIKHLEKERRKAHGPKRAKIGERLKSYEDRRIELAAEAKALGAQITEVELDIEGLEGEIQDVAATPDTSSDASDGATATPTAIDTVSSALDDIALQERAGVITPESASAQRISYLQRALGGEFGALDQRQTWNLMGDLREAQQAATEATSDLANEIKALREETARANTIASSELAIGLREARRVLADVVSNQLGAKVGPRALMPGSGELSRL